MAEPIVLELQRLATESSQDVVDLLRKALIVATKLGTADFKAWIERELNGYQSNEDVPPYRVANAQIEAFNPVQGRLIPYYLPPNVAERLCKGPIIQPIGTLWELARSGNATFRVRLKPQEERLLLEAQGDFPMQPVKSIPSTEVTKIIDAVRTTILEWALRLESEGILGDGIRFSDAEKQKAATSTNIHIGNFQGILGDVSHSDDIQTLQMTVTQGDFERLRQFLEAKGVGDADIDELKTAIDADSQPVAPQKLGENVSGWIGKMVSKAASGAWNFSVATAASLLANAISAYYGIG